MKIIGDVENVMEDIVRKFSDLERKKERKELKEWWGKIESWRERN